MRGHWRTGVVAGLSALLLTIAGCTGGGDTEPTPEPEPTETTPTGPPPQPEGADGVTLDIQNWDEYAEDEVVLAWKRFTEGMYASFNEQEILPAARENSSREAIEDYLNSFEFARDNDYTVPEVAKVKIESVERDGQTASLVVCGWGPTISLYRPDGDPVSDDDVEFWSRDRVSLSGTDEAGWVVEGVEFADGQCDGGPPA